MVSVEARSVRVTARTVWTFARLIAEDGSEGWGEASLEGRSAELEAAIRAFALPIRLGAVPYDLVKAAAYSAVEQALWDLSARNAGRPIAELLGGARRDRVPLYANINRGTTDRSPAGFAARAAEAAALGFGAIKIAPFDNPQEGYARIAAVADAIAGRAELQVDCHWRFDEARAQEALGECARLGVTWFECPLPETPEHFAAIKRLRGKANAAGMRLAGAEQFIGTAGFRPLLEQGLYDVVMPDVKYAGGLAECLRIAELAARHGVACSLHNPSGPVCHAHSLHASAAMESNERLEYQHGETPRFYEIAPGLAAPVGGSAVLPGPISIRER
ncbi:MAG TPA: mandelate racemase/muconate lactonizing enzyme family protein [Burkholderiales bacterium]|nr:mandelate racemase/muconate lactonizing enzyme family protein [Burkholderiales bacterium]